MLSTSRAVLTSLYAAIGDDDADAQTSLELVPPFSTISHADWARSVRFWLEHGTALLAEQPPRACPACGSAVHRLLFTSYDGYPFAECLDCGCWYVPRQVDQGLFDRFFEQFPQARANAQHGLDQRASSDNLTQDLERIGAYLDTLTASFEPEKAAIRYLDIGAGMGSSLIAARERGITAVGVEIDPNGVQVGLARGVDIRNPSQGLPEGPFDLISFWESLEHICDPLDAVATAARRLAPNGLLALTVPNLNSPMAQIMRGDAAFICGGSDGAGHINLFGPSQLQRLLERAGLELLGVDGQYASNVLELAGYLLGRHRGATSLLDGTPVQYQLPSALARSLMAAGPAMALAERNAGLTPILFAVAARKADFEQMAPVAARLAEHHKKALAAQAEAISRGLPDFPAQIQTLQREIAIRDEWLERLRRKRWWRYLIPS